MDMDCYEDVRTYAPEWVRTGPYLSVIIPALNEAENIQSTIQSTRDRDVEILVVDGGSTDPTVEQAIQAGARIVISPKGRAVQQNVGAAEARGDVLLFLHADTRLSPGYVAKIFEVLMDTKIVAGAFRFRTMLQHPYMKGVEAMVNARSRLLNLPYGDQGLFMRKALFREMGGFPEVPIAEDLLLVRQITKRGRIRIAAGYAVTSARRWQTLGMVRTTWINCLILAGCLLRISPHILAPLYNKPAS
jgi:rSAM/selenodomain-associated transferase 2